MLELYGSSIQPLRISVVDPLQALFAFILLAIWYLTNAIGVVLGYIVHYWELSIVVIGFITIAVLARAWNSERR